MIILIKYDNELLLIIERKTLSDLASSVKDGRCKQQKIRLLNNFPKHKICYLIEGDLNKSKMITYRRIENVYIKLLFSRIVFYEITLSVYIKLLIYKKQFDL